MEKQPYELHCTNCGATYPMMGDYIRCRACGGALELPLIEIPGPRQGGMLLANSLRQTIFSRYGDFFPYFQGVDVLSLGEGFTPLIELPELADETGADVVYIKNESTNPTWSFKDRGTAAGLRRAMQLGYTSIGTVSSGNMGLSVAAFARRASLPAYVLVQAGIDEEKLRPMAIYGAHIIKAEGAYDAIYNESFGLGKELGIYFINSDDPFRVEGYKTLAYEVAEQLKYQIPDYVIVPTSSGGHIRGILKGFLELRHNRLIDKIPRMVCVQAAGCAPIAEAFTGGAMSISPIAQPHTLAHAILNPCPPNGNAALKAMREHGGICLAATDEEMLSAQKALAESGFFVQPASAASYAALRRMGQDGLLTGRERVVCVGTSSGLKYTSILQRHELMGNIHEARLDGLKECLAGLR